MAKKKNSILVDNITSTEQTVDVVENNNVQEVNVTKRLEIEDNALEKLNDYIEEIEKLKADNAKLIEKNNELLIRMNEMAYELSQRSQNQVQSQPINISLKDNITRLRELQSTFKQQNSIEASRKKVQQQLHRHVSYNNYRNNGYSTWN